MKFSCSQMELNAALQIVSKVVSNKTTLPALTGILFDATKNELRLVGNDLNIMIETTIEANIQKKGAAVIPSGFITELVRKLPPSEIHFTLDEKGDVSIECAQLSYKILSYNSNDYPERVFDGAKTRFHVPKDELARMIRQTKYAISKEESRPTLTGALFELEGNMFTMVAIDGFRMAISKLPLQTDLHTKFIVPEKALNDVLRLIGGLDQEEDVAIEFTEQQVKFLFGKTNLYSTLIAGEFTNYRKILPSESKIYFRLPLASLVDSIDRSILVVRENKNQAIRLEITDEQLEITSNSEVGNSKEVIPIRLEGDNLTIGFNPKYLMDSLKAIDAEEIELKFTNNIGPCTITSTEHDRYLYLLLPTRL